MKQNNLFNKEEQDLILEFTGPKSWFSKRTDIKFREIFKSVILPKLPKVQQKDKEYLFRVCPNHDLKYIKSLETGSKFTIPNNFMAFFHERGDDNNGVYSMESTGYYIIVNKFNLVRDLDGHGDSDFQQENESYIEAGRKFIITETLSGCEELWKSKSLTKEQKGHLDIYIDLDEDADIDTRVIVLEETNK